MYLGSHSPNYHTLLSTTRYYLHLPPSTCALRRYTYLTLPDSHHAIVAQNALVTTLVYRSVSLSHCLNYPAPSLHFPLFVSCYRNLLSEHFRVVSPNLDLLFSHGGPSPRSETMSARLTEGSRGHRHAVVVQRLLLREL